MDTVAGGSRKVYVMSFYSVESANSRERLDVDLGVLSSDCRMQESTVP